MCFKTIMKNICIGKYFNIRIIVTPCFKHQWNFRESSTGSTGHLQTQSVKQQVEKSETVQCTCELKWSNHFRLPTDLACHLSPLLNIVGTMKYIWNQLHSPQLLKFAWSERERTFLEKKLFNVSRPGPPARHQDVSWKIITRLLWLNLPKYW